MFCLLYMYCCIGVDIVPSFVYICSDLMQNPLIVPVKVLRGHATVNGLGNYINACVHIHTHIHTHTHCMTYT